MNLCCHLGKDGSKSPKYENWVQNELKIGFFKDVYQILFMVGKILAQIVQSNCRIFKYCFYCIQSQHEQVLRATNCAKYVLLVFETYRNSLSMFFSKLIKDYRGGYPFINRHPIPATYHEIRWNDKNINRKLNENWIIQIK